ncbi:hypothetical protein V8G54_035321 [Vigna mungo]|uniref:Uncharacterized protein n=1 Tax=Vigna mungo TaxID=3915 RepID=A0AAQ3MEZ2_VIGMU
MPDRSVRCHRGSLCVLQVGWWFVAVRVRLVRRKGGGSTVKKARKAKYVLRVPSTIPFSNASTRPDVGSSRPPPPSMVPTPSVGPTPSTIGPTPSVVGPTPPTVVPTPLVVGPTPSLDVHQPSTDVVDPADTDDLDGPAPRDQPFIEPCGKGFLPSRVVSQAITRIIKQQFLQPWASWGVIPDDDKKLFWERFKEKVQWAAEHEAQIQKNFNMKASHRLSEMFRDARIAGQRPHWAAALGRAVHVDEVFTQTHIRKETGEYVDERSRKTIEDFSTRLTQARPEGGYGPDGSGPNVGLIPSGEKRKDDCMGAGRGGIFKHQPSTSTTFDPNNVVSKDAYDSLLARFENLENLVRTLVPQQGHTAPSSSQQPCPPQQPPFQTTAMQDEDSDDSDDPDNPDDYHRF